MEKGAMWLIALLVTATVSGESRVANSSSYLDAAITGFDPFYMTALTQPNPGRRSKIFQPSTTLIDEQKTVLYSFVNEEQDETYLPEITLQQIVNFNDYLDFTASAVYELSSNADCLKPIHRYENYSSCKTMNHQRDSAMLQFFKDTGGEVLFARTDIVTHTITLSSFVITTFTPAFEKAVETLYKNAVNTGPENAKSTFNEFVRLYGTHFSRQTLLGSRAIFGKLFSTRAATVEEESERRRCVREAAREALTPCMRGCNETTQTVFNRASERCGGEEHESVVAVTGPLPERTLDDWASAAKDSPSPLFHELEPLSTLFTSEGFEDYFDGKQVRINGTILSQYFDDRVSKYSRRMAIGGSNSLHFRGCGLNSDCQRGTECRNEPATESGFSCIPREDAVTASTPNSTSTVTQENTTPSTGRATTTSTTTTIPKTTTTSTNTIAITPTTTTTTTMRPRTHTMEQCSAGELTARWGLPQTLTSHPGFGSSSYENNMNIVCTLSARPDKVRITIQNFSTEANDDFLSILENSVFPITLATLSGTPPLATYTISGYMILIFVTDGGITGPGFSLTYEAVE